MSNPYQVIIIFIVINLNGASITYDKFVILRKYLVIHYYTRQYNMVEFIFDKLN